MLMLNAGGLCGGEMCFGPMIIWLDGGGGGHSSLRSMERIGVRQTAFVMSSRYGRPSHDPVVFIIRQRRRNFQGSRLERLGVALCLGGSNQQVNTNLKGRPRLRKRHGALTFSACGSKAWTLKVDNSKGINDFET